MTQPHRSLLRAPDAALSAGLRPAARRVRRVAAWMAVATACAGLASCDGLLPHLQDPTVVLQRTMVAERLHSAFPHALRLRSGEVLVTWREGAGHIYPPARLMMARYRDTPQGLELIESGETFERGGEDEREGGLAELSDGTVVANLFTGHYEDHGTFINEFWFLVVLRSADGGRSWRDTVVIPTASIHTATGRDFDWLALRAPVVELAGGELLMPVYGQLTGDRRHSNHVLRSSDGGRTWRYGALIARDARQRWDYNETSLLVDGARVVAVFRSEDGWLRQSESADGGATWSPPRKLDVWGVPPHLLRLADGRVLLSHGYRKGNMGVRYALSDDGGHTWDPGVEGVLYDASSSADTGYPSTVQLDDGSLLTVYYASRKVGGEHQTFVEMVRYQVADLSGP